MWNEAGLYYTHFGDWILVEDLDPGSGFEPAAPHLLISGNDDELQTQGWGSTL